MLHHGELIYGGLIMCTGFLSILRFGRFKSGRKKILVTGANRGVGFALVKKLSARNDVYVYLGSRDYNRGIEARDKLEFKEHVEVVKLDVTKPALLPTGLFAVVHNAGTGFMTDLEQILEVNCYGPKRIDDLLLPDVRKIVYVTSPAGPKYVEHCDEATKRVLLNPVDWNQLVALMDKYQADKDWDYCFSKAILNAYMMLVARDNPSVIVNACVPGFLNTALIQRWAKQNQKTLHNKSIKPPEEGTFSIMKMIFEVESSGGHYGSDGLKKPMDRKVY